MHRPVTPTNINKLYIHADKRCHFSNLFLFLSDPPRPCCLGTASSSLPPGSDPPEPSSLGGGPLHARQLLRGDPGAEAPVALIPRGPSGTTDRSGVSVVPRAGPGGGAVRGSDLHCSLEMSLGMIMEVPCQQVQTFWLQKLHAWRILVAGSPCFGQTSPTTSLAPTSGHFTQKLQKKAQGSGLLISFSCGTLIYSWILASAMNSNCAPVAASRFGSIKDSSRSRLVRHKPKVPTPMLLAFLTGEPARFHPKKETLTKARRITQRPGLLLGGLAA